MTMIIKDLSQTEDCTIPLNKPIKDLSQSEDKYVTRTSRDRRLLNIMKNFHKHLLTTGSAIVPEPSFDQFHDFVKANNEMISRLASVYLDQVIMKRSLKDMLKHVNDHLQIFKKWGMTILIRS